MKPSGKEFLYIYENHSNIASEHLDKYILSAKKNNIDVKLLSKLVILRSRDSQEAVKYNILLFIEENITLDINNFSSISKESKRLKEISSHLFKSSEEELINIESYLKEVFLSYEMAYKNEKNELTSYKSALIVIHGLIKSALQIKKLSSTEEKTLIKSLDLISIVFNKAYSDARVKKAADSLYSEFSKGCVFGYDIKNEENESYLKEIDDIYYFISGNIKREILHIFKSFNSWSLKYRSQQLYFSSFILGFIFYTKKNHHVFYSHDMHGIAIGDFIKKSFNSLNESLSSYWIHDFHEYVAGVEFSDETRRSFFVDDEVNCVINIDQSITVSPGLANILENKYNLKPILVYNSNSSIQRDESLRHQSIRVKLNLNNKTPLIIYSGGITKQRRVGLPLTAMVEIQDLIYCIITNDTPEKNKELNDIFIEARSLGVEKRIHLHRYVSSSNAWELMVGATACLSMLPRYENGDIALPNKLFDSLKAGVPFLTSNTPELDNFVNEYHCGTSFLADDANSLTTSLKRIINSSFDIRSSKFKKFSWDYSFRCVIYSINDFLHHDTSSSINKYTQLPDKNINKT
ncbi:hypothetical protein GCM10022421_19830 [Oceanisphaera sediminis]|uniref:Glycosyl transferase family 1 domain-containing protein n=1 Tax=Oceanisphaera sediminis TaxID=981381 RepID=A0ABP7E1V0_9GAMM